MAIQLQSNSQIYTKVLGSKEELEKVIEKVKGPQDNIMSKKYWLSNLDMGQLLASTFSRLICFWSSSQSNCYVPHHVTPDEAFDPIHICFVDDCHWVLLEPNSSCTVPIPTIFKIPHPFSKKMYLWKKHLKEGRDAFRVVN